MQKFVHNIWSNLNTLFQASHLEFEAPVFTDYEEWSRNRASVNATMSTKRPSMSAQFLGMFSSSSQLDSTAAEKAVPVVIEVCLLERIKVVSIPILLMVCIGWIEAGD